MPRSAIHPATLNDERLLVECSRQTTRRSGPGGQHRNKTETAVVLTLKSANMPMFTTSSRSAGKRFDVTLLTELP
jgi:protein subunit release factor B